MSQAGMTTMLEVGVVAAGVVGLGVCRLACQRLALGMAVLTHHSRAPVTAAPTRTWPGIRTPGRDTDLTHTVSGTIHRHRPGMGR